MTAPRVLVVQHQETCPPALFGRWLADAGCEIHGWRAYLGEEMPEFGSYDAVLVLGGEMGAHDDSAAWLGPLKEALVGAVEAGTPVLGICLGHQLMAVALGGDVRANPRGQSLGLLPVGWTSSSAEDHLVRDCRGEERGIHWNSDVVVDLPDAAVVLAQTPDGDPQVVHYGHRAWGIQAHPEADADVVRRWAEADRAEHRERGIDQEALLTAIAEAEPALARDWEPIATRFAAMAHAQWKRRQD